MNENEKRIFFQLTREKPSIGRSCSSAKVLVCSELHFFLLLLKYSKKEKKKEISWNAASDEKNSFLSLVSFFGGRFIFRWEKMKESPTHCRVSRPLETPRPIPPRTECVCVRVRVWVHALERERVIVREKGWGFYANESWANRNEPSSDQIPSCPWLQ